MLDRKIKAKVYHRDGNRCLLCHSTKHLTVDHIIPKSQGGGDNIDNLQILCEHHNRAKGSRNNKDYRGRSCLPTMNPYMCEE